VDLGQATVRELILLLARVEETGRCDQGRAPKQAARLAECERAIVKELRSRSSAARDTARASCEDAGAEGGVVHHGRSAGPSSRVGEGRW
jgi:hypothetical protein